MRMPDLNSPITYQVPGIETVRARRDLVYGTSAATELRLDVYTPAELADDARLPGVFFVHGGPLALDTPSPKEWGQYIGYGKLAGASGLAGITFNHRFHSPADLEQAAGDVSAALEFVRAHSAEFKVDAERLCLWVFSGGGVLLSPV